MREEILHVYAFNLNYARTLIKDIPADLHTAQPNQIVNHPVWVIGHLASTAVFVAGQLGKQVEAPENLRDMFGPVSVPNPSATENPSLDEMMALLEKAHAAVADGFREASDEFLAAPAMERLRSRFPTNGHFITFALTSHETLHLGQLSSWRRAAGLGKAS